MFKSIVSFAFGVQQINVNKHIAMNLFDCCRSNFKNTHFAVDQLFCLKTCFNLRIMKSISILVVCICMLFVSSEWDLVIEGHHSPFHACSFSPSYHIYSMSFWMNVVFGTIHFQNDVNSIFTSWIQIKLDIDKSSLVTLERMWPSMDLDEDRCYHSFVRFMQYWYEYRYQKSVLKSVKCCLICCCMRLYRLNYWLCAFNGDGRFLIDKWNGWMDEKKFSHHLPLLFTLKSQYVDYHRHHWSLVCHFVSSQIFCRFICVQCICEEFAKTFGEEFVSPFHSISIHFVRFALFWQCAWERCKHFCVKPYK